MKKFVLIILTMVVCGAAVWLGTRYKPTQEGQDGTAGQTMNTTAGNAGASASEADGKTPRVFQHRERSKNGEADQMDVWDKQIDTILASQAPDAEIADQLLKLYPQMPTNGQADLVVEITQHVSNENYGKISGILTNSATPTDILDVLLTDVIERPDNIRMPILMALMRDKQNPKSEDAHDFLEVIVGDDYGEDWDTWSKKIAEWMARQPDE